MLIRRVPLQTACTHAKGSVVVTSQDVRYLRDERRCPLCCRQLGRWGKQRHRCPCCCLYWTLKANAEGGWLLSIEGPAQPVRVA